MDDYEAEATKPPRSRGPLWLFGIAVVAAIVAGIFINRAYRQPLAVAPAPSTPIAEVADAGSPLAVDFGQGDNLAAAGIRGLGSAPELQSWANQSDLVRRIATAVNLVADGESPRPVLEFMQPGEPFGVERKGVRFYMSAASEARYDRVTAVLDDIDTAKAGRLYGTLSVYLDAAFGEVARPGKHFEDSFRAAVDRLAGVKFDGPLEVVPMEKGVGYAFADPKLEALSPAEKHLLRMGPKNASTVVAKLKAFEAAAFAGT